MALHKTHDQCGVTCTDYVDALMTLITEARLVGYKEGVREYARICDKTCGRKVPKVKKFNKPSAKIRN